MFVYFPWIMGRPGESAETAVAATGICNDLSICTMEMTNIIQWLDTCYKAGYLSDKDTGLHISKLGTLEFFENLSNMIAHREGFGDIDEIGLNRYGERIFNLQRGILLREGLRPPKDDIPEEFNFTDPVESVFMNPEVIIPGVGEEVISRNDAF